MNDQECINTIRALAADVVQKANSGHPGAPIGMAPVAHVLFSEIMRFNSGDPTWVNRDRFVLSNGHGCALLYIMLHLSGYKLSMDDLKQFRQLNSITPGHPENIHTPGVEVTTGPLGQGLSNGVGMAIAQKHLSAVFNKDDMSLLTHKTYVFCGDGCLQEGVSLESISLAGHLALDNLVVVYDDNHITIDGNTKLSFTEDVGAKMRACGWHTTVVEDGNNDLTAIRNAFKECEGVKGKPCMIMLKTIIGYGTAKEDTAGVHGSPLGDDNVKAFKTKLGRDPEATFVVSDDVYGMYKKVAERGAAAHDEWNKLFATYKTKYPGEAADFERLLAGELPEGWQSKLPTWKAGDKEGATRALSGEVLNALAPHIPNMVGGSADLTGSNVTAMKCTKDFQRDNYSGRYFRFGVREHGMTAVGNGIASYITGGLVPYLGTFLNFIGYAMGAVRMSAISHHGVIFVATHDSIGLGEDGPTHQPVEVPSALRALPNCVVIRPADGNETAGAWAVGLERRKQGPTVIGLSRQGLPHLQNSSVENLKRGAYVVHGVEGPKLIVLSSGSEVGPSIEAAKAIGNVQVVSFPSWELFEQQPLDYKKTILPDGIPIVSVEAWACTGWEKYSHVQVGMNTFGVSAPYKKAYAHFGMDAAGLQARFQKIVEFYSSAENRSTLGTKLSPFSF